MRRSGGTRRVTTRIVAATVAALVPLVAGTPAPVAPAAHVGHRARPPAPGTELIAMASRSAVRAAMLDQADPEAFMEDQVAAQPNGELAVSSSKGTRVWTVSALSKHDVLRAAERAYRRAAAQLATSDPGCDLSWTLLAAIGRVESDHGRYGGSRLGSNGLSRPRIIGVALDGVGPVAAIHDTDRGRLDGDRVWDRAVGPMQFIPSTWASAARDGDADGRRSPHDLDDAAAAAASYLCAGPGSLSDPVTRAAAIYRYNQDDYYVALVRAFEVGYRTGSFVIPAPPADEEQPARRQKRKKRERGTGTHVSARSAKHAAKHAAKDAAKDSEERQGKKAKPAKPAGTGSTAPHGPKPKPTPAPTPKPSPQPAPPQPVSMEAVLTASGGAYYLGGQPLELGVVGQLADKAVGDFDGDGTVGTNGDELAGMVDQEVTMVVVALEGGKLGIYSINGIPLA